MSKIVALSFFSGGGGLDIGSHMAGVEVLASLDFDKDSILTLKQNKIFKNTKIFHDDITKFDFQIYQDILNKNTYDKFILIGGPPCQPFSKAGYWVGNKQRKKDKDPRNMMGAYLEKIEKLKPDGFLLENVESLLHPSNKHVVEEIKSFLDNIGYDYIIYKANALDFGVAQKRKRIFFLGSKKKIKGEPKPTHGIKDDIEKTGLIPHINTGEIISKFDRDIFFEKEEVTLGGTYHDDLQRVPPGKNYIALTKEPLGPHHKFIAGKRFWNFLLKLSPDIPSWTIAAGPGPWVGPFHRTGRRLRVPEIAAIQSFPESYKFYGSRRSIQRQIGNAVPPLLGKGMISFLKDNI